MVLKVIRSAEDTPEYDIKPEDCKKLEGEAIMNGYLTLGRLVYGTEEAHEIL